MFRRLNAALNKNESVARFLQSFARSTPERKVFTKERVWAELYVAANASKFGISVAAFRELLLRISLKCLSARSSARQMEAFCRKLYLRDLVLAHACSLGEEAAWQEFLCCYADKLYRAALTIAREDRLAREMADTLLADLFCGSKIARKNKSKLSSYTGRGPLESWLKAILFQSTVDRYRAERRYVGLEDAAIPISKSLFSDLQARSDESSSVEESLRIALSELKPEDKFLLVAYFLDRRSLAQIAGALRVHESTASRRLSKTLVHLRKRVIRKLRARGLDERTIADLLHDNGRKFSFDLRSELLFGDEMAEERS